MTENLAERVITVIAKVKKTSPEAISLDSSFDELGIDSLDALSLIFHLEVEFNIGIPNEEAFLISNVRQAVERIQQMLPDNAVKTGVTV